jgi:hypothetical protein
MLNEDLRRGKYDKVCEVINYLRPNLQNFNNEQERIGVRADPTHGKTINLYYGMRREDIVMQRTKIGTKNFMGGFLTTYTKEEVAKKDGNYLY